MLTTGLLIGSAGGAIAAADTESTDSSTSTGSTNQSQTADEPSQSVSTAIAPTANAANTPRQSVRTSLRDVIHKLQLLGRPGQQRRAVATPTADPVAPDTKTDNAVTPAVTEPVASDSNVVASGSNVTVPVTKAVASESNVPAPSTAPVAPVSTVVHPVPNAVATLADNKLSVPAVIMSLPTSTMPVADVITMIQDMLISVTADAVVLLAQVPSDLYSLLVAGMDATAVDSARGSSGAGLSAAGGAAFVPPLPPLVLPTSPIGGMPLLGDITAPATLGRTATASLSADLTLSGTAPLAADGVRPTDALSRLEHTVRAFLARASLSALAAIALPGVGGLLIICAAGMRVGYRQAKAALAVRTTGISRFARQGPLGVVRSGSLVALHPRALRVVRPKVSRTAPLLEQAA